MDVTAEIYRIVMDYVIFSCFDIIGENPKTGKANLTRWLMRAISVTILLLILMSWEFAGLLLATTERC